MISLSLKKISEITNGKLHGINLFIDKIVIDTKKVIPGCLFIALIGKKFDAHAFIKDAIEKGCSSVITQKKIQYKKISYILVKNTFLALGQIAAFVRKKTNAKVLAITGSCGKTSVKEMTASILRKNGKTLSTINNLNNNIGVPMTLLRLTKEHKYAVIELGASQPGEIAYTSCISNPEIILINNIHYAHLKGFKSLLGVSKAKSEIFSGMKSNGTVIINLDSNHLSQWKKNIKGKNILYFSIKKKYSNFFSSNINMHMYGTSFTMHTPSGKINISLPFLGYQNVSNALAASALSFSLNISLKKIQIGLSNTPTLCGRLEIIQLKTHKILINDTYNANVSSMIAAIKVLEKMPGYKILVTGDMAELGEKSILYHKMIGNTANLSQIDEIFSIGNVSYQISKIFNNGKHFSDRNSLNNHLKKIFLEKSKISILVKGSRDAKMEKIVEYLIRENKKNADVIL